MRVLVIAPHRDDEILGAGGTILKRKAAGDYVAVCVVTAREGDDLPPMTKQLHEELKEVCAFCGTDDYFGMRFAPNRLETYSRVELNAAFAEVLEKARPDEVYIPFWGDMQRDHRLTTEAAMVALRAKSATAPRRIYAYETLSETGLYLPDASSAFVPQVYEDITGFLEGKKKALQMYSSQVHAFPDLRSPEAVEALARFRGATVNVEAAEAFMLVREVR